MLYLKQHHRDLKFLESLETQNVDICKYEE